MDLYNWHAKVGNKRIHCVTMQQAVSIVVVVVKGEASEARRTVIQVGSCLTRINSREGQHPGDDAIDRSFESGPE